MRNPYFIKGTYILVLLRIIMKPSSYTSRCQEKQLVGHPAFPKQIIHVVLRCILATKQCVCHTVCKLFQAETETLFLFCIWMYPVALICDWVFQVLPTREDDNEGLGFLVFKCNPAFPQTHIVFKWWIFFCRSMDHCRPCKRGRHYICVRIIYFYSLVCKHTIFLSDRDNLKLSVSATLTYTKENILLVSMELYSLLNAFHSE